MLDLLTDFAHSKINNTIRFAKLNFETESLQSFAVQKKC